MAKNLRILMLNYEFPPLGGGAGNATYYLLREFSKYSDLEIDLLTSSVEKFKIQKFSKNITIHFLDINKKGNLHYQSNKDLLTYSQKAYKYSKELMKSKSFDFCHAFFGIPCGYIAMKLKIPYIVSLRGSDVPFYNKRFYWMDKFFFKRLSRKIWKNAKRVITNSKGLRQLALKTSPDQKIDVITNGVDTVEFNSQKIKKPRKNLRLISTGRLIERKGYSYLIDALKGVDNIELILVGDGNLRKDLENKAIKNKVGVKFLGNKSHKEIFNLLGKADVFVLPSLNEGMSNSILEAMACGLPIITTDTGGNEELIKGNGFIIERANSEQLRQSINKLLISPNLIKSMSNISRKLAEKMRWENIAKDYSEVYYELA